MVPHRKCHGCATGGHWAEVAGRRGWFCVNGPGSQSETRSTITSRRAGVLGPCHLRPSAVPQRLSDWSGDSMNYVWTACPRGLSAMVAFGIAFFGVPRCKAACGDEASAPFRCMDAHPRPREPYSARCRNGSGRPEMISEAADSSRHPVEGWPSRKWRRRQLHSRPRSRQSTATKSPRWCCRACCTSPS
ncbi:MAG: hypothetical protein QOG10_1776 [Kribbellaceae bacterium]|nr:hypothetical protein [Kribbellaceae bacterium]